MATARRSAARLRCCQRGARIPARRRGRSRARAAASRNFAAKSDGAAQLAQYEFLQFRRGGQEPVGFERLVALRETDHEAVVAPHGFGIHAALGAKAGHHGHAPRRMHTAAEGAEHADAPVAEFILAALDHDVAIAGHASCGGGLLLEVAHQVGGGALVEAVLFDEAREGGGGRHVEELAGHLADLAAELGGAAGAIAVPERHLAGLAGSGRDGDAIVRDLLDAPGGGAEDDRVAGAAFEDHFLIKLADPRAFRGAHEEDAEHAAIGNGAAVDDGDPLRALSRGELAGDAIPGDAGAEFGEFVGGIAAAEHVEDGIEDAARERGVGSGAADELVEVGGVPGVHRDHGDELLREHVEWIARVVHTFHLAFVHGANDGRAGHQVAPILGVEHRRAGTADVVIGAAHALHAAGDGRRRFDQHDQIDRAHIDAEFERGGGDQSARSVPSLTRRSSISLR